MRKVKVAVFNLLVDCGVSAVGSVVRRCCHHIKMKVEKPHLAILELPSLKTVTGHSLKMKDFSTSNDIRASHPGIELS